MKQNKGFTLVELLIVLALLGIVAAVIYLPFSYSFKSFEVQNEKAAILSELRETMDYLTREIRKADEVEVIEENKLKIISNIDLNNTDVDTYNTEDGNLYKNDKVFKEGIELFVDMDDSEIGIELEMTDRQGRIHSLPSILNLR